MYHVELYLRVRLACHRDGLSQREAARRFGIDRKTVAKILKHSVPPGYQRGQAPKRPKLDPIEIAYTGIIDQILEDDKSESKKQRHTCKRIFEWLRDEHGYSGGITIVTDYVRARKRLSKEVFVPLAHDPGHAQVDFGEAWAIIAGVKRKVHYFALDCPTAMPVLSKPIRRKPRKLSVTAMSPPLASLAAYLSRSSMTTRHWLSPRSRKTASGSARRPLPSYSHITYSRTSLPVSPRAMKKARWKG